jgi:hypothetical protein
MATVTHRTELQLAGEELLALADIRGARLRCVDGSVWLTLDRDSRDVFLSPGDSFVVDRDGVTLLHALAPTRLQVETCSEAAVLSPVVGWRAAMAQFTRRMCAGLLPSRLAGA